MSNLIAVTIGDIEGIGIKILIKEWKKNKLKNFILISNYSLFIKYLKRNNIKIKIFKNRIANNKLLYSKKYFNLFDIESSNDDENTINSIKTSFFLSKNNYFKGIVTLPLNKEKIKKKVNQRFIDQTNLLTNLENKKISNMFFIYKKIIFVPLTIHVPIKKISQIFKNKTIIKNKIFEINNTLKVDFNIKKPKILIAGLNPHSGEGGTIGNEEKDILKPILRKLKLKKINIEGPISPDSMVNDKNLKKFDCLIFAYHDQALITFKYISKHAGVNYTAGLDIIRTSPDHGTGYDIVNKKNNISSKGIINSFNILRKISKNRYINAKSKKIIGTKFSN
tara:strand:+ start:7994 stop:9001 length:1008 start_codon:yes stop_codon:yes gene_type:complete